MNKRFTVVMIAIWSFIAAALIGLLVCFIVFGHSMNVFSWDWDFNFSNSETSQAQINKSFAMSGISEINVNAASADVNFSKSQGSEIKVNITGNSKDSKGKDTYSVSQNGSTLQVTQNHRWWSFFFFNFGQYNQRISITLPESYKKNLTLNLASGDITFNGDYTFKNVGIYETSGNFSAGTITADDLTLKETSGDMSVSKIDARYEIKSVSGDIKLGDLAGYGDISNVSGDIRCDISKLDGSLKLSEVSGDMQVGLSRDIGADISASTVSGDVSSNFGMEYTGSGRHHASAKVGGSPYNEVSASLVSGDITFSQN
jgi:lia operon protein LiaG